MANKLGEVLEIEATNSYMKRPIGPMVTIEVRDITKLAGYIRIPSMAKGASVMDIVLQRILYSGLLNQCRKCGRFEDHVRICNLNKTKPREGLMHHNNNPPPSNEKAERTLDSRAFHQNRARASKARPPPKAQTIPHAKGNGTLRTVAWDLTNRPSAPTQAISSPKPPIESSITGLDQRGSSSYAQKDQVMAESIESPSHPKSEPAQLLSAPRKEASH